MKGRIVRRQRITRAEIRADRQTLFVFGDNMERQGLGGQAAEMRGEPNALGVPTKWSPSSVPDAYFRDDDWDLIAVKYAILSAFACIQTALLVGRDVVIPADGLGTGRADLPRRAPRIYVIIEGLIARLSESGDLS